MTIFVVTEGEYSDYRIKGIYSTKANAELHIKQMGGRIETYTLDEYVSEMKKGLHRFDVRFSTEGEVLHIYQNWFMFDDEMTESKNSRLQIGVWAKDEEHAIKIANEKRIQYLAEKNE